MNNVYLNKCDCSGCTACSNVCPQEAVEMKPDREGFRYPFIKKDRCINCGLCRRACQIYNQHEQNGTWRNSDFFALKHKSESVRMSSASGGAYTAISDLFLNRSDAVIYGVRFGEDFEVEHGRVIKFEERERFKGSKYVQSRLSLIFSKVREDLMAEKEVLFTGTPCQVEGLKNYLKVKVCSMDKLTLNDIICHGVSSPLIWQKYINVLQKDGKLKSYTFRDKFKGWHGYNISAKFENQNLVYNNSYLKLFARIFSSDTMLRPSCYKCRFANLNRVSDITIGDFWGIEKVSPGFVDEKGVSLVILNSEKGRFIFEKIKKSVYFEKRESRDCIQHNLSEPTKEPKFRKIRGLKYLLQL